MPHGMNTGTGQRSTYTPLSIPNPFGTYPTKAQTAGKKKQSKAEPAPKAGDRYKHTPLEIDLGIKEQPTIGQTRGAQREARPAPTAPKGDRYKYTPLNIDLGIKSQPTKAQSSSGKGRTVIPKATVPTVTKPSAATTTEAPTQNPERPGQPSGGVETPALGGGTYTVMGVEYDSASGQAINPDTGKTSSGGYSIDPKTSQRTDYSRGQTRTNANGVTQTGTSTSPAPMTMKDANSLLSPGYSMQNPFSSNQLPSTKGSPYVNVGPLADGAEYARNLESQKPGAVGGVGPIASGEQYAKNVEAGEQLAVKPTDTATNWGARTAADNSDPKLARRRAFLDAESSMQGLRNVESQMGISYAGGQHNMVNPNKGQEGQNDFVSIGDKDDVRGYKSGRLSAQDMRDKYVTKIKDNGITSYDEEKVSSTAGPLADADAYSPTLKDYRKKGPSQSDPIINQDKI